MLITNTKPIIDIKIGDIVFIDAMNENPTVNDEQIEVLGIEYPDDKTIRLKFKDDDYSDVPIDAMIVVKNTTMGIHVIGNGQITKLR